MHERQEGFNTADGEILINFTYMRDLQAIIVANWSDFSDVFEDRQSFSVLLDQLNCIRRREAHNRAIDDQALEELDSIYKRLMGSIAAVLPEASSTYLLDNWRRRLSDAFEESAQAEVNLSPGVPFDVAFAAVQRQVEHYQDLLTRVSGINPPPKMQSLHDELMSHLARVRATLEEMVHHALSLNAEAIETTQTKFEAASKQLLDFRTKYLMTVL